MSKHHLPAMQWYPGDWRKDVGVQSLSFYDRGVWFEMLMLMHESEERGKLVLNGRPMSDEMIARAIGLDNQTFNQTLTTLLTIGVAEREPNSGAIINRRMVRDEEVRKVRKNCGKLGGNPALVNQKSTTGDNQKSTPSSSSSSSSSKNIDPDFLLNQKSTKPIPISFSITKAPTEDEMFALATTCPKLKHLRDNSEIPYSVATAMLEAVAKDGYDYVFRGTRGWAESVKGDEVKFTTDPYKFFSQFQYRPFAEAAQPMQWKERE